MNNSYSKYFAAQRAAGRWESEIMGDLREIGEAYMKLWRDREELKGAWAASWSHFPADVEGVEDRGDTIYVWGSWTRRGCTDSESCHIPTELVYADKQGRAEYLANMQKEIDDLKQQKIDAAEQKEREQLAALKAKYEGGE